VVTNISEEFAVSCSGYELNLTGGVYVGLVVSA